jgi:hypothetical protein
VLPFDVLTAGSVGTKGQLAECILAEISGASAHATLEASANLLTEREGTHPCEEWREIRTVAQDEQWYQEADTYGCARVCASRCGSR